MARHILSLDIPDTRNECVLCIMDTSLYADKVPVECPYIDILPPGFTCAVRLEVEPQFCKICFTACDLGLQTDDCGVVYNPIPDGVYAVKYSVAPNEHVFVEYNHLRITDALNKLNNAYCDVKAGTCDPLPDVKEKLKELRLIESLLKAAKAKVEYCHTPKEGMDLYEYALKRLNKLNCSTC